MAASITSVVPPRAAIPVDDIDCRFTQSFPVEARHSQEAATFFNEYGFIIFKDVVENKLCSEMRKSMWGFLEQTVPGFQRKDEATWSKWAAKGFGMPGKLPVFSKETLRIRQHENIHACFAAVMNYNNVSLNNGIAEEDIVCSHDRWVLYRKTKGVETSNGKAEDRPDWRTRRNIHLDMNPWEYQLDDKQVYERLSKLRYGHHRDFVHENNDVAIGMGQCVQGILNLKDNLSQDGGTLVVPGSHHIHDAYFRLNKNEQKCSGSMQYPSCHEHKNAIGWKQLEESAQRVSMLEGSLVIWDQRLMHGSAPNMSSNNRLGLPIRFFRRDLMTKERIEARADALLRMIKLIGFGNELSETGKVTFGLDKTLAFENSGLKLCSANVTPTADSMFDGSITAADGAAATAAVVVVADNDGEGGGGGGEGGGGAVRDGNERNQLKQTGGSAHFYVNEEHGMLDYPRMSKCGKSKKGASADVGADTMQRLDRKHPSIENTVVYDPSALQRLAKSKVCPPLKQTSTTHQTKFEVIPQDTIAACLYLIQSKHIKPCEIGALNFASAKNPGGGFKNGSGGSQEESLCRSTGLYLCLNTHYANSTAYDLARKSNNDGLYHNFVIYSPSVPMIKDRYGELIENGKGFDDHGGGGGGGGARGGGIGYEINFLTCPAPNAGVARNRGRSEKEIEASLTERINAVLNVASEHGVRHLVLGAFGCGVFKNDPRLVASVFASQLKSSIFQKSFDTVVFAVLERDHISVFKSAFGIQSK